MITKNRIFWGIFFIFVAVICGCKQEKPFNYLQDDHYVLCYEGGTYFELGIPCGINMRVNSGEYSISTGKNCGAISSVFKIGTEEYVSVKSGIRGETTNKISEWKKQQCCGDVLVDFLNNLEITEKKNDEGGSKP